MVACADIHSLNCIDAPSKNCGTLLSYPFFTSFILLSAFMITNLFLAVVMDNFMYLTLDSSIVYCQHIHHFIEIWQEFDSGVTGKLHSSNLIPLLRRMPPPLGFGQHCPKRTVYAKLASMDVPVDEQAMIWYKELLLILLIKCLRLRGKNQRIRKDILAIDPNTDGNMLDRVLPPRKNFANHPEFKIFCASNAIKYYFRVFVALLKKIRKQQSNQEFIRRWRICIGKSVRKSVADVVMERQMNDLSTADDDPEEHQAKVFNESLSARSLYGSHSVKALAETYKAKGDGGGHSAKCLNAGHSAKSLNEGKNAKGNSAGHNARLSNENKNINDFKEDQTANDFGADNTAQDVVEDRTGVDSSKDHTTKSR